MVFSINGTETIKYTYLVKESYPVTIRLTLQKKKNVKKTQLFTSPGKKQTQICKNLSSDLNRKGKTVKVLGNNMGTEGTGASWWYLQLNRDATPFRGCPK